MVRCSALTAFVRSIEAPGIANGFSLVVFFDIADALDVDPADLIRASVFPDQVIGRKENKHRLLLGAIRKGKRLFVIPEDGAFFSFFFSAVISLKVSC